MPNTIPKKLRELIDEFERAVVLGSLTRLTINPLNADERKLVEEALGKTKQELITYIAKIIKK